MKPYKTPYKRMPQAYKKPYKKRLEERGITITDLQMKTLVFFALNPQQHAMTSFRLTKE